MPGLVGIVLRSLFYRLILRMEGLAAIEAGVRLRFADHIRLGRNVYLDEGVYLHACPQGIEIGADTYVMHHAELHVYNFRDLPHAGIRVGRGSLIGEFNCLRGQGGIVIGDRVYFAPLVQVLAVNHVYDDPHRPFVEQGITAQGIVIENDVWVGAGAIILDGVHIGCGAVIAAGAVVTEDVPAHTVAAGVPARVVRTIDGTWRGTPAGREVYQGAGQNREHKTQNTEHETRTTEHETRTMEHGTRNTKHTARSTKVTMTSPDTAANTDPARILSVVLPAYNERDAIGAVLERLRATAPRLAEAGLDLEILVVDDGSRDGTREVVGRQPQVTLICHERNQGYGAAIKTGFRQARGRYLAFLDADGTYPPEALPELCRPLLAGEADLVIGCRMGNAESRMPAVRRVGNAVFALLLTLLGNARVRDSASGMRALNRAVLPALYPLPDGLNFTPVMSARALHEGLRMVEVPIAYEERVGESKLHPLRDGMRFLRSIVKTVMTYNPVRPLGLAGVAGLGLAGLYFLALLGVRLSGVTALGPWGTLGVFAALVLAVSGVSLFTLGATFNALVAFFHRRPVRQGLFGRPFLPPGLERHFGWAGLAAIGGGILLAAVCMGLALRGWELVRLWLYLVGSAGAILVGVQLGVSWLLMRVMEGLSRREAEAERDLGE